MLKNKYSKILHLKFSPDDRAMVKVKFKPTSAEKSDGNALTKSSEEKWSLSFV